MTFKLAVTYTFHQRSAQFDQIVAWKANAPALGYLACSVDTKRSTRVLIASRKLSCCCAVAKVFHDQTLKIFTMQLFNSNVAVNRGLKI